MPFSGGVVGALSVGAKTWRPKTNEQAFLEAEQKRLTEQEQLQRQAVQQKIQTLDHVRKIEAKTQALNEMAMAAEIRIQEHDVAMKERQVAEARRVELAKLELAKRLGRESLSEADLARIRRERMKAELLARAAGNHAAHESIRPINPNTIDLGHSSRLSMPPPPPPPPHHMPLPPRAPSAASHHHHPPPIIPMPPMSRPHIPMPAPPISHYHRRVPSEPGIRMRRMSGGMLPPAIAPPLLATTGRSQWGSPSNALRGPNATAHFDRPHSARPPGDASRLRNANLRELKEDSFAQLALRAQAERLRRRRLATLDLKARQLNLRAQALRDLRKRELAIKLRERGLQQREIDTQLRLMNEREKEMTETQLRDLRDREHRLLLKEKGLQEREILEQVRKRDERDREILRCELERLERELRRAELMDAEMAIKEAYDRGLSPPMGILRPSIDEIENEGLLCEDFFEEFESLEPRLRAEIMSQTGIHGSTAHYYPAASTRASASIGQRTPNPEHRKTPGLEARTPLMRGPSPSQIREESNRLSEANRIKEEALMRSREGMLGDRLSNNHHQPMHLQRQRSQSFDRRSPGIQNNIRTALLQEVDQPREREEISRAQQPSRSGTNQTPLSQHRRTPSMRDNLDVSYNDDSTRHLDPPFRSASRASSRGPATTTTTSDLQDIPRSLSRSGSVRDAYSPAGGASSRPVSRNLTVEDLGLGFPAKLRTSSREREREPLQYTTHNDDLLTARLHSAQLNSQYNGGTRSRANSRAGRVDADLSRSARGGGQAGGGSAAGFDVVGAGIGGRRSRANSRAEWPTEDLRSASRNQQAGPDPGFSSSTSGRRSRANSASQGGYGGPSRSPHPSEFSEFAAQEEALRTRESRRNLASTAASPHEFSDAGWGSLTSEELRQLSADQVAGLLLNETGDGLYPTDLPYMSEEEINQLTAEQMEALLHGNRGEIGSSRHEGLGHRTSRASGLGLGDSPPFGGGEIEPQTRSRSRNEYSSNTSSSINKYNTRTPSPNPSSTSLYNMPGHFQVSGHENYDGQLETGEFVITDEYEHPNTRIVENLGRVQADNFETHLSGGGGAGGTAGGFEGLSHGSHLAVNNLVTLASRLGATGVIGLRVVDYPGGRYVAQGEAVVLANKY